MGTVAAPLRICRQQCHISQHWVFSILFEYKHPPNLAYVIMVGGLPKTTNEAVQVTLEWMKTA